ncbi:Uncharacterised protein [Bordetella pertussis]|nr:Uncharacterised protein [Bordetella pertussis]
MPGAVSMVSPASRQATRSSTKRPSSSSAALACAIT